MVSTIERFHCAMCSMVALHLFETEVVTFCPLIRVDQLQFLLHYGKEMSLPLNLCLL